MGKDYFIKLSLALYRVTGLFPEREPLKFYIRERANKVLGDLILFYHQNPQFVKEGKKKLGEEILKDIELLQGYFEVGKRQDWVKETNFLFLAREYAKIEEAIKKELVEKQVKKRKEKEDFLQFQFSSEGLRGERCKKILEVLGQKETGQVKDFKVIFPQVSKRTLRRDFEYLLNQGLVERIGDKSRALYKLGRTEVGQG